jgi:hypothetical protein
LTRSQDCESLTPSPPGTGTTSPPSAASEVGFAEPAGDRRDTVAAEADYAGHECGLGSVASGGRSLPEARWLCGLWHCPA